MKLLFILLGNIFAIFFLLVPVYSFKFAGPYLHSNIYAGKCVGFEIKLIPVFSLIMQGAAWKSFAGWK